MAAHWYTAKKRFRPAFGYAQHPKAGRNTQQWKALVWPDEHSGAVVGSHWIKVLVLGVIFIQNLL